MRSDSDVLTREILLAFWKVHILHHAGEGPVYGQWIAAELRRHGYDISPGTLYPLLRRLETHGWLKSEVSEEGPKAPRYYRLTDKGREVLVLIHRQLREFYEEVLPTIGQDRLHEGNDA